MKESCSFSEFLRLAKLRQSMGELSAVRQLLELLILFALYRVGPGFYQMAGFWKKGIPWSDKTGHLTPTAYRKVVDQLNHAPYRKISQNKLSETAILRLFHVPSPEFLGYFNQSAGQTATGAPLRTIDDLRQFLQEIGASRKICFKPLEGWAGRGFEIGEVQEENGCTVIYRVKNQTMMTVESFKAEIIDKLHQGSSMIEAYLQQHTTLSSINPSSVNTVRLWAASERNGGQTQILLAYLRIGRAGSLVDNQSSGGIVAPIDLESGKLQAATDGLYHHNVYHRHPDHNSAIEGVSLPHFNACKTLADRALAAFPKTNFAGMDIAISPDGPQIIEMNLSPDREGAAFVGLPSAKLLKPFVEAQAGWRT